MNTGNTAAVVDDASFAGVSGIHWFPELLSPIIHRLPQVSTKTPVRVHVGSGTSHRWFPYGASEVPVLRFVAIKEAGEFFRLDSRPS